MFSIITAKNKIEIVQAFDITFNQPIIKIYIEQEYNSDRHTVIYFQMLVPLSITIYFVTSLSFTRADVSHTIARYNNPQPGIVYANTGGQYAECLPNGLPHNAALNGYNSPIYNHPYYGQYYDGGPPFYHQPYFPANPHGPTYPHIPVVPHVPHEPHIPLIPNVPYEPHSPGIPVEPHTPVEPHYPVVPHIPAEPQIPEEHHIPTEPHTPIEPPSYPSNSYLPPSEHEVISCIPIF